MANGYARASGRVGVLATIPGPGFAFALPGLAEARLDSAPLLHLVGTPARGHEAVPPPGHRPGGDGGAAGEGASSRSARPRRWARGSGRPTPSPWRASRGPSSSTWRPTRSVARRAPEPASEGDRAGDVEDGARREWAPALRELVDASERPVVFLGAGALTCPVEVRALVERLVGADVHDADGPGRPPRGPPLRDGVRCRSGEPRRPEHAPGPVGPDPRPGLQVQPQRHGGVRDAPAPGAPRARQHRPRGPGIELPGAARDPGAGGGRGRGAAGRR